MTNVKQARDVQFEPCLQRKKRLDGPTTTLSSDFNSLNNTNIEYILLGKNDKFQDNIKYKCRPMRHFDDPQVDDKGNDLPTKSLQDNSPKHSESDQYILLGNNTKFANNVVYKLKPFPNGTTAINEEDKENALFDDNANRIKAQEGITKLEEYILLGKNDKFSDNVVYRPKVRREFIPSDGTENENSPIKATDYFPVQTKPLEPAPIIDTSKFREPPKKCKNPVEKNDDSEIVIKKKKKSSASHDKSEQDVRLPLDHLLSPKQAREEKGQTVLKKGKTDADKDVLAGKSVKFQSPPPAPRSPNVNEETDKKLLGLLHKSKIYIPPHSCVTQSEYQKNFTWKKPLPNFPTAAENKKTFQSVSIFKANTSSPDPILKLSEYQRNFQAWTPSPTKPASPITSAGKAVVDSEQNVQRETRQKAEKMSPFCTAAPNIEMYSSNQRTNTDEDQESKIDRADISVTTPEMSADDDEDNEKQGNSVKNTKRFESVNNPSEKIAPVNNLENLYSEYTANFKAPSKCHYVKNAWDVSTPADENIQNDGSVQSDWYSEVLDLRRKASEYRHRAENTHFCSGRMELDKTQPHESAVSREDVRNLKSAGIIYSKHNLQNPTTVQNSQLSSDSATESQMMLEDVSNDADVSADNKPEKDDDANCPHTMSENDTISAAAPKEGSNESSPETESQPVGRIPTPELQEQHIIRHHLDRTTPTKGNLLITSPMTQKQIEADNATEHANSVGSHSFSDAGMKPKHCVQTCSLPSKINSVHTFGKPSKDARILGDQGKISSRPFHKTSSVQESQRMNRSPNVTLRSGNKRPKKIQVISEKRPAGIKGPMPEFLTSAEKDKTDLNHDFLSQSLDSNNSLATEVLERTRKRLNFW